MREFDKIEDCEGNIIQNGDTVYYENRISDEKLKRTISITATPHLIYNRNGELIKVPDQSWGIAKDM